MTAGAPGFARSATDAEGAVATGGSDSPLKDEGTRNFHDVTVAYAVG